MPSGRPKCNRGPFSTDRVLNSNSPIVDKEIHSFLVTSISGWDVTYNETEKRKIIDSLPPAYRIYVTDSDGKLRCPISIDFVHGDPYLKAAVKKFKNDVGDGYYEKAWQSKAKKAMQERREGKFDEYLKEHAEEMYGEGNQEGDAGERKEVAEASSESDWAKGNARQSDKTRGPVYGPAKKQIRSHSKYMTK